MMFCSQRFQTPLLRRSSFKMRAGFLQYSVLTCTNFRLTLSWLNLTRSLSQLKEARRRRCSHLKSDPARSEDGCWAGMRIPC